MSDEGIKDRVKEKYGQAALRVIATGTTSCCGSTSSASSCDPVTSNLYDHDQTADLPEQAVAASLGCGNPTALAELAAGETVLDLGSGGGIDVLLSADRKSTRLNSSHLVISYAVFCLKKKKKVSSAAFFILKRSKVTDSR